MKPNQETKELLLWFIILTIIGGIGLLIALYFQNKH